MVNRNKFIELAISRIPYILSLQDRNQFSPTYGSFDREYWQYKKTDTPYASVQSSVLSLALLYKNKIPNNPYYKKRKILEWIIAGMSFLGNIQKNDGSFDEYYPNERSYIGTALTIYPCSEAFLILNEEFGKEDRMRILSIFEKSADYLSKNSEQKVLNQEAMSFLAIYVVNTLLRKRKFEEAIERKLKFILSAQSKEGWFPEYGGCDIGYLSYTIDFIATYYKKSNDKRVLTALNRAIEFISYFLHPNGTVGGEYTARGTEYLVPHGFQVMADINPLSNAIISFMEESLLKKRDIVSLDRLDNRYLPLYTYQYIQTSLETSQKAYNKNSVELPFERKDFSNYFKESGIFVKKQSRFYIIIGTKNGGVIKIYNCDTAQIVLSDCGYVAEYNGKVSASSYMDNNRKIEIGTSGITIKGCFYDIVWVKSTMAKHIMLRSLLFNGTTSKIARELIKNLLITRLKLNRIEFSRKILMTKQMIIIKDEIISDKRIELSSMDKFSFRYIPSSKFFLLQELETYGKINRGRNKHFKFTTILRLDNGRAKH